jgi:hypothetical protein
MFLQRKGQVIMTIELLDTEEAQTEDPVEVQVRPCKFHTQQTNCTLWASALRSHQGGLLLPHPGSGVCCATLHGAKDQPCCSHLQTQGRGACPSSTSHVMLGLRHPRRRLCALPDPGSSPQSVYLWATRSIADAPVRSSCLG